MKRVALLFFLLCCSLTMYSQICWDLYNEYHRLDAQYETLRTTNQKKACIKEMERILHRGEEINCGFTPRWSEEVRKRKQLLYPTAVFGKKEYVFNAAQQEVVIGVKLSGNIQLVSYPSWMKFTENEGTTGFIFQLQENLSVYERTGVVEVKKDGKTHKCTVRQEATPLLANVTEHIGFGQEGGEGYVFVETNDTAWEIYGSTSWLKTEYAEDGIMVVCQKSPDKRRRSAKFKVRFACGVTRTVEIDQGNGRPVLTVPQTTVTFNNNGGKNDRVIVRCDYDQWTATPSDSWIRVRRKYDGISIECDPNTGAQRTATIKIATKGTEHIEEKITVVQAEAASFLYTDKSEYSSDGTATVLHIPVKTNFSNWNCTVEEGSDWATVSKAEDGINVDLARNDLNAPRTAKIRLSGGDHNLTLSVSQPNRGYVGRYNDYTETHSDWRLTWFSIDVHGLTTLGNRLSFVNTRWKFVELSLVGFTVDYFMEGMVGASWEPIARAYMPVTRDGKWAAYLGMGAHISMTGGFNYFLLEAGMEIQWNEKYSSHIFFKYNGECTFGMSFDIGKWYNFKK